MDYFEQLGVAITLISSLFMICIWILASQFFNLHRRVEKIEKKMEERGQWKTPRTSSPSYKPK